ncbi:neutral zinc metallopeptidase [Amycolatopsis suaedae]|uniref:Aminopeptidase n=1 Tax=Amycolatopsis suaedae TaxID=2510978 RepID=A0A4Q7IYP4_9PSEU|nr:neutral zinc metallopeptidase [Amycolatopsis suaedae]RZQ59579.1 aminopeptidase [Amycolatopsis suaedae]
MSTKWGRPSLVGMVAVVALLAGACGDDSKNSGEAKTSVGDVAGLPVTHFESGLKPDAPKPQLNVRNATDSEEDKIAIASIADVSEYWTQELPAHFGMPFEPVKELMSYDPSTDTDEACGTSVKEAAMNAFYCPPEDLVAWDRGQLLPMLRTEFGPMAIVTVLGHEFGHAVQYRLGEKAGMSKNVATIVKEQQADCFTGGYFRWMAEEKSKYFRVSTSEGLNQVLASLFFIRDQAGQSSKEKGAHGTAFDRTYAFQLGFEKGAKECAGINQQNIDARITEQPFHKGDKGKGDERLDMKLIGHLQTSLDKAFEGAGAQAPKIVDEGGVCPGGPQTPPASYCPDSNTVSIDLNALSQIGRTGDRKAEFQGEDPGGLGDFAALAEVASRYTMGIQKGVGASLDNDNAGLRTSCLVGAWAAASNRPGANLRLSSGDLDEAIAELLMPKSVIAADVNGKQVENGFERVESLRKGYMEGSTACTQQYG